MKRSILAMAALVVLIIACTKDTVNEYYTFYRPVYQTRDAVKDNIKNAVAVPVTSPGKMVLLGQYVFLNDIDKGIHVIDIADPSRPKNIAFINIPGCADLAVNGHYLYADCYTALVTLDISNPQQVQLKQFMNGVFPHRYYIGFTADTSKVITEWVRVDTMVTRRFSETLAQTKSQAFGNVMFSASSYSAVGAISGIGVAGSLARFALLNNRMYTVSQSDLKVFNITTPAAPSYVTSLGLQQGNVETIFPYKSNLLIGTQTGMFIYNASNPDQPQKLGQFSHVRTCDPVIADGNYAYVTLSGGSTCGGFSNQLDVLDIRSLTNPSLIRSYNLTAPKGLAKDGDLLLICDGKEGIKIFDAKDPAILLQLKNVPGFEATDVIAQQGIAIATAKDGLYCIDYTDVTNAKVIGKIPVTKTN